MYELTLTSSERQAIDFVGDRYPEGDDLFKLLWHKSNCLPGVEWESKDDIAFTIPEHIAWQIKDTLEHADSNYGAALFASEFREKLMKFCERIV